MKKYRKVLTIVIILIVALLMFASFFGANYKNKNGESKNLIPNYKIGMEFGKTRVITAEINKTVNKTIKDVEGNIVEEQEGVEYTEENGYTVEETPVNEASVKTVENYRKAKKIIEERLSKSGVTEYFVDLDELTGKIKVQIPENEKADEIEYFMETMGTFALIDLEDGQALNVVFDNSYIKEAKRVYMQGDIQTVVCLQLTLTDEGIKKIHELSEIYTTVSEDVVNENGETETLTNSKELWILIDGNPVTSTVLDNIMYGDTLLFPYWTVENDAVIEQEAIILNSGMSPVIYSYSNEIVDTKITENDVAIFGIAILTVFVIVYIYLIFKFKARGFISVYFQIGFLGILLLIIRLTNVTVTMEGIAGIIVSMVLEFIFSYVILKNMKSDETGMYKKSNLEFFLNTLPLYAIALICTFANKIYISSFGATLFWGILIIYVYNFIFTKFIFENLGRGVNKNENN